METLAWPSHSWTLAISAFVGERIGRRCGAQGVHAETVHLGGAAGLQAIFPDDVVVDRTGIKRPVEVGPCGCSSPGGTRGGGIGAVARERQVLLDQPLRHGMHGNEPDLCRACP
jgi:hypothetical protein